MRERNLVRRIRRGVVRGNIPEQFRVADIPFLHRSPSFLSKHCIDNPGNYTEYFRRVGAGRGLYELIEQND